MNAAEISEAHLKTYNKSWDYYIDPNHSIEDLSINKIQEIVSQINNNRNVAINDSVEKILKKYELIRENKLTYAGYLLFLNEPSFLTTIEAGRFTSETLIKDSISIRTNLFDEVNILFDFIKKHINKRYIISGKTQRDEIWDYPLDAIREIVINMVVHRDYSSSTDSIVKIFDNKIEFYNPGKPISEITVNKLISGDYISYIRNVQIAYLFKEAGLIEKYGSGIKRIFEAFKKEKLKLPKLEILQNGFRITIFKTPQKNPQKTPQKMTLTEEIMAIISENNRITQKEIAERLGISFYTVKEYITKMRKKDLIERIGAAKGGYWRIKKNNE